MKHFAFVPNATLLAGLLTSGIFFTPAPPLSAQAKAKPQSTASPVSAPAVVTPSFHEDTRSQHATMMYRALWGVEDLRVQITSSSALVRFSYRIFNVNKAAPLNDDKNTPVLIVEKNGAKLDVPTTEKVGTLRQTAKPEIGREYWMVFTNSAHMVNPGDRVDIQIGRFRANGLTVEAPQAAPPAKKP